jgi:hypothetical protein
MSQKAVENVLGRILTDPDFRHRFFEEPAASCRQDVLDVTSREIEAILTIDEDEFVRFAKQLDPRIVRAATPKDPTMSRVRKTGAAPRSGRFRAAK